jgi:hypothetical protein
MTDQLASVLVPYSRFLECQDRRQRHSTVPTPRGEPPATDAHAVPALAEVIAAPAPLTANNADH